MPQITVTTQSRPGPASLDLAPGARYFVAGIAERGNAAAPTVIHSMAEYADKLGNYQPWVDLFDDLSTYFAEGGVEAVVARLVGPGATSGTIPLPDSTGPPSTGSSLVVTAANPGAWSAGVSVEVVAGAQANTFQLNVYYQGALVERYNSLASPADAIAKVNAQSNYVTLALGTSVAAAPANNPAPTAVGGIALSAGIDDRANITAAIATTTLAQFTPDYGPGALATPTYSADLVGTGFETHARTFGRSYLGHPPVGSTAAAARAAFTALLGTVGSEFCGGFAPWVRVPNGAGGTRLVPPTGYVAGVRARAIIGAGPWRNPAGDQAAARYITDVERVFSLADIQTLDFGRVSAIRKMPSAPGGAGGIRLYGYRSLSGDEVNYYDLTARQTLDVLAWLAAQRLESFLFDTVDGRGHFFDRMNAALEAIVEPWRIAGGLFENHVGGDPTKAMIDPGYVVDTGPDVNTPASLAANRVNANVGIRLSPSADFIYVAVTKVAVGTALT